MDDVWEELFFRLLRRRSEGHIYNGRYHRMSG